MNIDEPSKLYTNVPSLVRVGKNELTCLKCGETYEKAFPHCPRCRSTKAVPTVSYLRDDEYYIAR